MTPGADRAGRAASSRARRRVVVVGGGFGGYFAARTLARKLKGSQAEVVLVSDTDALVYQPLLPEVAVGAVDPRAIAVPLVASLPRVRVVRGQVTAVDVDAGQLRFLNPAGVEQGLRYGYLLLAPGSVTRLVDIPGLADHAVGFKTVAEALYLRELILHRMETATLDNDPAARRAALTFVVVGAGYAGTELCAQMARLTSNLIPSFPKLATSDVHWVLLDVAPAVMPELGESLGGAALNLLRARGIDVRLETSVDCVERDSVVLSDGTRIDCSTVIWAAGVTANPLITNLGLPTRKGRLVVDENLAVPGHPEIYAIGDAAAVPDVTNPAHDDDPVLCPPTAQHAMRQGPAAARNIVAAINGRPQRAYKHRDLGLVVDLGGTDAAAKPLGIKLRGRTAKVVARGYHLYALPTAKRRLQVLTSWALAGKRPDDVSFGLLEHDAALAATAEHQR
jgi:NADH dehydrogenase